PADEQQRRQHAQHLEQVKPAVTRDGPDAPEEALVEPLEVGKVLSVNCVCEGVLNAEITTSDDLAAGADLPGEIEVRKRPPVNREEQQQEKQCEEVWGREDRLVSPKRQ